MKMKFLFFITILFFLIFSVSAQTITFPAFKSRDARLSAMSDVFRTVSTGAESFFGNPAGYIGDRQDILLAGSQAWVYSKNQNNLFVLLPEILSDKQLSPLGDSLYGFGTGIKLGIGYAGRGLGLGLFVGRDSYAGTNQDDASYVDAILCGVFGVAVPFETAIGSIRFGFDLRPFYRLRGILDEVSILNFSETGGDWIDFIGNVQVWSGFGVAVNAGVIWDIGFISIGAMARDISPNFTVKSSTFDECITSFFYNDKSIVESTGTAKLEPDIALGLCASPIPKNVRKIADLKLGFEIHNLSELIYERSNFASSTAFGAELTLVKTIIFRAGFNNSKFSLGAGLRIMFLDIDLAIFDFAEKDLQRSGIALQFNIRL